MHPGLALAIISVATALEQDRGAERGQRRLDILRAVDFAPGSYPYPAAFKETLFGGAILRDLEAPGRGRELVAKHGQRLDRDILELVGDDVALLGEAAKRFCVVIVGTGEIGGHLRRTWALVGIEDVAFVTEPRRRQRHHSPELSAAQNADDGTGGQSH